MKGERHTPEQIVRKLREAERLRTEGADVGGDGLAVADCQRPQVLSPLSTGQEASLPPVWSASLAVGSAQLVS